MVGLLVCWSFLLDSWLLWLFGSVLVYGLVGWLVAWLLLLDSWLLWLFGSALVDELVECVFGWLLSLVGSSVCFPWFYSEKSDIIIFL